MTGTAKNCRAIPEPADAASPFSAMWAVPVPALEPLGKARIIHSWERTTDLWRPTEASPTDDAQMKTVLADLPSSGGASKAGTTGWRKLFCRF